ncbi:HupE/UreJ family protein [Qipengyuania marisflavi]|nr:HupE/UreJ family protein [Qipengyuania marisflavi]
MSDRLLFWLKPLLVVLMTMVAAPLSAHSTPNSEVRLKISEEWVVADIIVPQGEYAFGTGNPVDGSPRSTRLAREYLADHIDVATPGGKPWTVSMGTVEFVQTVGPPYLHAIAYLVPPAGADVTELSIDWQVLNDELPGHFALFLHDAGAAGSNVIIGAVRKDTPPLEINNAEQGALAPLIAAMALGAHHIMEGYDHLLFLLVLLLPAPLLARAGAWGGHRSTCGTVVKLAQIVTAFTVGHSLTLIAATLGNWSLPTAPVEVAIALSVLISAMHAARPILPGKEPIIALVFGLVHGLAFATLVKEAQAGMASSALTLLGFNLGIELVQLAIVAAVVPSLLILSRYRLYAAFRQALAYLGIAAAAAWIVNRTTGLAGGVVATMEAAMGHAAWLVVAAALLALVLVVPRHFAGKRNSIPLQGASA